jgi:hypothetical protein
MRSVKTSFNYPTSLFSMETATIFISTPVAFVKGRPRPILWAPFKVMSAIVVMIPVITIPIPFILKVDVTTDGVCLIPRFYLNNGLIILFPVRFIKSILYPPFCTAFVVVSVITVVIPGILVPVPLTFIEHVAALDVGSQPH